MHQKHKFNTIDEALEDIVKGKMVILVDDEAADYMRSRLRRFKD